MRVTRATKQAVKYACLNFHYAKCVPAISIGYNVYNDNDEWCGCILYGYSACQGLNVEFNLPSGQLFELTRVALNGKQECTSKAVAMSLKQLHIDCPLCRLVISYADCDQDHLGTIYQATNWIYIGTTRENAAGDSYVINGKKRHSKHVNVEVKRKYGISTLENIRKYFGTEDVHLFVTKGKRKYLMPLDKKMRKQIMPLSKPYPKNDENWQKVDRSQFSKEK